MSRSFKCFKHCKQFNINYTELREDFSANIAYFVHKLQLLRIETSRQHHNNITTISQQHHNNILIHSLICLNENN